MFSVASSFFIGKNTILFLSKRQYRVYSGKIILNSHVSKVKDFFNLQRSRRMIIFENLIIMLSSTLMTKADKLSLPLYNLQILMTRLIQTLAGGLADSTSSLVVFIYPVVLLLLSSSIILNISIHNTAWAIPNKLLTITH